MQRLADGFAGGYRGGATSGCTFGHSRADCGFFAKLYHLGEAVLAKAVGWAARRVGCDL
jgi:hypothetical protein